MEFFLSIQVAELLVVLAILLFFSFFSFKRKALDLNGIILGNVVGATVYFLGGFSSLILIVLFFVVAEFSTRYARLLNSKAKSHETRTMGNILGNSGAAIMALVFLPAVPIFANIAFFGAVSAALADTLSSEIGLMSKEKPRLITTLKKVEPGTDGGITALGLLSAVVGAFLISLIYYGLTQNIAAIIIITIAGLIGSMFDSVLGAVLERRKILNNTTVNFFASCLGAVISYVLFILL